MVRILFTINNLRTAGMKYVIADLVKGLDKKQFQPIVGVNHKTGSPLEKEIEKFCPVEELILRVPRKPKLLFPVKLIEGFSRLKRLDIDIAHSFDYASDWTEGLVMKMAGVPWVVEKTNLIYDQKKWKKKLSLASMIVCLSRAQLELMPEWEKKCVIIPTGIDVELFKNAIAADRTIYGFQPDDLVLISIAHLVEVKGHKELLQAFAVVKDEFPRLRLLFAGEGDDYTDFLKNLASELGISDRVCFAGNIKVVAPLVKMSDGKILATRNTGRREGFGAALVEAMAADIPVIATKSGGPEEIVIDQKTGWLINAEGYTPIVQALRDFCTSPLKRKQFADEGQKRAFKYYTKEIMIDRLSELYTNIIEDRNS